MVFGKVAAVRGPAACTRDRRRVRFGQRGPGLDHRVCDLRVELGAQRDIGDLEGLIGEVFGGRERPHAVGQLDPLSVPVIDLHRVLAEQARFDPCGGRIEAVVTAFVHVILVVVDIAAEGLGEDLPAQAQPEVPSTALHEGPDPVDLVLQERIGVDFGEQLRPAVEHSAAEGFGVWRRQGLAHKGPHPDRRIAAGAQQARDIVPGHAHRMRYQQHGLRKQDHHPNQLFCLKNPCETHS